MKVRQSDQSHQLFISYKDHRNPIYPKWMKPITSRENPADTHRGTAIQTTRSFSQFQTIKGSFENNKIKRESKTATTNHKQQ